MKRRSAHQSLSASHSSHPSSINLKQASWGCNQPSTKFSSNLATKRWHQDFSRVGCHYYAMGARRPRGPLVCASCLSLRADIFIQLIFLYAGMAVKGSLTFLSSLLVLLLALIPVGLTVEVTPDSPCSNFCINRPGLNISDIASSNTFSGDLSCLDIDYNGENSTAIGRKFRSCVSCEQSSNTFDANEDNENDVYWFLCRYTGRTRRFC